MVKFCASFFLTLFFSLAVAAQAPAFYDFKELDKAIADAPRFDKTKEYTIDSLLRKLMKVSEYDLPRQYDLCTQLYNNYKLFKYDSAYEYARKSQEIAYRLQDKEKIVHSSIILNFTLLSSGLFKETDDSLHAINMNADGIHDHVKADFYSLKARYFYDLADYSRDKYYMPTYNVKGGTYLDTALQYYTPGSFSFSYYNGLKNIRSGKMPDAQLIFIRLMARGGLTEHELALTASTLSDIYIQNGNVDSAIALLIEAAVADVKSSTKETSAMFNLAQLLYRKGDVKNASKYIEYAINDAAFYGARQRKVQLISILPLIEMEKINQVESQKKVLVTYAIAITALLLLVILLSFTIYRQVTKLKHAQKTIYAAHLKEQEVNQQLADRNAELSEVNHRLSDLNTQLSSVNAQLSDVNIKLSEANKIKEEYIGYFFNANSEFFNRIERFKKSVEQKIADRKLDEIRFLVNNINLRREKEDLLKNFDKAFLKLFPHFIYEFNQLFKEEDRFVLKDGEMLNTDLRIFALIRMGIHDIEKIAHILEYSINTINTYKTRIKNKSVVPNEEFETHIMNIKTR
jgi:TolA-binding protein